MKTSCLRGLYAITDSTLIPAENFSDIVEQAIIGGACAVQYRDKTKDTAKQLDQARALHQLCQKHHIPLIINDNVELAQQISADGVHLGKHDGNIATARAILGNDAIIGVSCYNRLNLAEQAVKMGASYVAFGSFFNSSTKPNAIHASIDLLYQAKQRFKNIPIVAIGGITPENGKALVEAGVDCLAVIQGLFGQSDIKIAAQQYNELFD